MSFYTVAKTVVKIVFTPLYRLEVKGLEHFPKDGGVLLCSNHINELDPLVVGILVPRDVHFMAKEELFSMPILKQILPHLNAFPVKRGMSDREALRKGLSILKEGKVLGLFPEGTRSKTGELGKGLAGAGFFGLRTDAQIIPCCVIGQFKLFRKVKVIYGPPISMDAFRENKTSAETATNVIMEHISRLISENK